MLTKKELHNLAKDTIQAFEDHGQDGAGADEVELAKGYLALEKQLRTLKRVHGVLARMVAPKAHEKWCGSDDNTPGCCRGLDTD